MAEQMGLFDQVGSHKCSMCGCEVRVWKKRIISTAVASLCRLVYFYRGEPIHHDKFTVLLKDRNFSQLVLWDLIEAPENEDPKKRSSGEWSPTQSGIDFVRNVEQIRKYIVTKNNVLLRYEGPLINISEALNMKFDYSVLMSDNFIR